MATEIAEQNLRLSRVAVELQRAFRDHDTGKETDFARDGAVGFEIPQDLLGDITGYFSGSNERPFSASDAIEGYSAPPLPDEVVDRLNSENAYYGSPDMKTVSALTKFVSGVYPSISNQLGYDFKVVNVRAWKAKPGSNFGPSGWHCDGAYQFFLPKLMLYINGPDLDKGTIEFFTRGGQRKVLSAPFPTAILLDSSSLLHRGRPSLGSTLRPMIEMTIAPDVTRGSDIVFAGQNARFPLDHVAKLEAYLQSGGGLRPQEHALAQTIGVHLACADITTDAASDGFEPPAFNSAWGVNIGGGPSFVHPGWINLDEFPGPDVAPVSLSNGRPLPIPSSTIQLVYSSHCLEHLPLQALEHCLSEAHRMLRRGGDLVIKVPDYEAVLAAYRARDASFFADSWGLETISHLWPSRGISDTIEYRASMIFCGFWNAAYGHEFGGARGTTVPESGLKRAVRRTAKAIGLPVVDPTRPYHGPVPISLKEIRKILEGSSPAEIAASLRHRVVSRERDFTFNHQMAFSEREFGDILARCGFELISMDGERIRDDFAMIPGIKAMENISAYYHCRRPA